MLQKISKLLPRFSLNTAFGVLLLSLIAIVASSLVRPKHYFMSTMPHFEMLIPKQFGEWRLVQDASTQVSVSPYQKSLLSEIYDETLMRTYEDGSGNRIMLALAYAHEQKQEIKVHRPEVCYPAQGLNVLELRQEFFSLAGLQAKVRGKTMLVTDGDRYETVSYWIRMGNQYPSGGLQARLAVLKSGLFDGTVIDGVLVRVSISSNDLTNKRHQFLLQNQFISSLISSLSEDNRKWFLASN